MVWPDASELILLCHGEFYASRMIISGREYRVFSGWLPCLLTDVHSYVF